MLITINLWDVFIFRLVQVFVQLLFVHTLMIVYRIVDPMRRDNRTPDPRHQYL